MFGYFPVGVIIICCYVIVFCGRKIGMIRYFPVPFYASSFKSKQEMPLYGERQCFDIIYFSRVPFPF